MQQGLPEEIRGDKILRDQLLNACQGVEECNLSLYKPPSTFEGVCAELRSAIGASMRSQESSSYNLNTHFRDRKNQQPNIYKNGDSQFWTDRVYEGRGNQIDTRNSWQGNGFYGKNSGTKNLRTLSTIARKQTEGKDKRSAMSANKSDVGQVNIR